jgi:hypothetical protein
MIDLDYKSGVRETMTGVQYGEALQKADKENAQVIESGEDLEVMHHLVLDTKGLSILRLKYYNNSEIVTEQTLFSSSLDEETLIEVFSHPAVIIQPLAKGSLFFECPATGSFLFNGIEEGQLKLSMLNEEHKFHPVTEEKTPLQSNEFLGYTPVLGYQKKFQDPNNNDLN